MSNEALIENLRTRQSEAQAAFAELVRRIVNGETIRENEALKVLANAAKTPDDLEKEVTRLKRIGELQTIIDRRPEVEQRRVELITARGKEIAAEKEEERAFVERRRLSDVTYFTKHNAVHWSVTWPRCVFRGHEPAWGAWQATATSPPGD